MRIKIISAGGTINKFYNELTGELEIGESVAQNIYSLARGNLEIRELSIIGKDSLDMNDEDRALLAQSVKDSVEENIIILHGTDTMDKSAAVMPKDKKVVFVGSMKPYSIEKDEAIFNFACAVGFLRSNPINGVYISMHSLVLPHDNIYKDRAVGAFKPLK
jgi:L-asparaginase